MLVTVFVFIGIEGASVYSRFANERRDVGWATIVGFIAVGGVAACILPGRRLGRGIGVAGGGESAPVGTGHRSSSLVQSFAAVAWRAYSG